MIRCLFEQSGTFKNCFKELGYQAEDWDISNDFKETDRIVDLFEILDNKYEMFEWKDSELIIAFFPCIRFSTQFNLCIQCHNQGFKDWSFLKRVEYSAFMESQRSLYYQRLCRLISFCVEYKIPLIIENPYTNNYLLKTLPIKPAMIDNDRTVYGDTFKKPTMYFFINCEPQKNYKDLELKMFEEKNIKKVNDTPRGIERSLIEKDYVMNFIKEQIKGII